MTKWNQVANAFEDEGNAAGAAFASAARTATPTAADIVNVDGVGINVVIKVTAATATPSVVFTIYDYDPVTGDERSVLASAAITGTGTTRLRVHPAFAPSANAVAADILGRNIRIRAVHADADSITYAVGYSILQGTGGYVAP